MKHLQFSTNLLAFCLLLYLVTSPSVVAPSLFSHPTPHLLSLPLPTQEDRIVLLK